MQKLEASCLKSWHLNTSQIRAMQKLETDEQESLLQFHEHICDYLKQRKQVKGHIQEVSRRRRIDSKRPVSTELEEDDKKVGSLYEPRPFSSGNPVRTRTSTTAVRDSNPASSDQVSSRPVSQALSSVDIDTPRRQSGAAHFRLAGSTVAGPRTAWASSSRQPTPTPSNTKLTVMPTADNQRQSARRLTRSSRR